MPKSCSKPSSPRQAEPARVGRQAIFDRQLEVYGYELLWVQPVAMLIGCVMLFALSHQTLSTGEKPFAAMRDHVHPSLAWL